MGEKTIPKIGHKYGIQNCISLCQSLRDLDYKLNEISFYVFSKIGEETLQK